MADAFDTSKCNVEAIDRLDSFTYVGDCAVPQAPPVIFDCLDIDTPLAIPPIPGPTGTTGGITVIMFRLDAPMAQGDCSAATSRAWTGTAWDHTIGMSITGGVCDSSRLGPAPEGAYGKCFLSPNSNRYEVLSLEDDVALNSQILVITAALAGGESEGDNTVDDAGKPEWPDASDLWAARLVYKDPSDLSYDLNGETVWAETLDFDNAAGNVPLLQGEKYLGKYVGEHTDDTDPDRTFPLYAIRRNDKLFRFVLKSNLGVGGTVSGKMLWWTAGDWAEVGDAIDIVAGYDTMRGDEGDECLCRWEPVRGVWLIEQIECT